MAKLKSPKYNLEEIVEKNLPLVEALMPDILIYYICSHFVRTDHTYSMELSNSRVWDYVGDNYVHRLVQNKEDGKLVEMDERGQRMSAEKKDSLALEVMLFVLDML